MEFDLDGSISLLDRVKIQSELLITTKEVRESDKLCLTLDRRYNRKVSLNFKARPSQIF